MNARHLAPLLVLVACGGRAAAPTPAPMSASERAFVDEAEAWHRAACACLDHACASEAWAQQAFAWPPEDMPLGEAAAARLGHAYVGFHACYVTAGALRLRTADVDELVARATAAAAAACACETPECARPHLGVWLEVELSSVAPISDAGAAQLYRAMVDARRCERRIEQAAEPKGGLVLAD